MRIFLKQGVRMILIIAIIVFIIGMSIRCYLDYRHNRAITSTAGNVTTVPDTAPKYAVGSTVEIYWQQHDAKAAYQTLENAVNAMKLSVQSAQGIAADKASYFAPAGGTWQSFSLGRMSMIGDRLCMALSLQSKSPVIAVMEYDQSCWGYAAFVQGRLRSYFWNIPQFVEEDPSACRGDAKLLASLFNLQPGQLAPYIRQIDPEKISAAAKAFPDDEYPLADHWVRVDFLRRLGITYPESGNGKGCYLYIPELDA